MTPHWHAYTYTGPARPRDADARDPATPTPPLVVGEWPRKPRSMLAGTFTDPGDAAGWLERQLTEAPPLPTGVPAAVLVAYARARLTGHPGDAVTRYYTAGAYAVRDLVPCSGACPGSAQDGGQQVGAEGGQVGEVEGVADVAASALGGEQARAAEGGEVAGDLGG
jgi:hypothetical protein